MAEVPSIRMDGKVALVTGGGAGIGRAVAEAFAGLGAQVVVAELDQGRVKETRRALEKLNAGTLVVGADVREDLAISALMTTVEEKFGKLDILVNNVGDFLRTGKFESFDGKEWDELYQINLRHIFAVTRAALPLMRKSGAGGSIINMSSFEGYRGMPTGAVYAAFKHGIVGFTKSLAVELGPEGIRVNAIAPDTTETAQVPIGSMIPADKADDARRWWPLGRYGAPSDAAGCAIFLATDLSAWVTGTTIHLDGGALAACGFFRAPDGSWTNKPVISGGGLRR